MDCNRNAPAVRRFLALFTVILALASAASAEWKEKVLYSFQGLPDGATPVGAVVFDKAGNLYGATRNGGSSSCPSVQQCGTVYQLAPPAKQGAPWTETVLYIFKGNTSSDGASPYGGLVIDNAGNLYGTTGYGGTGNCTVLGSKLGCGTVFELSPPKQKGGPWTETVLYSIPTPKQGFVPWGDLVFDGAGNLYGSTIYGGGYGTNCGDAYYQYCGAVFELSPPKTKGGQWKEKTLYGFKGDTDGANPNGGLVLDSKGNVYGTTYIGGYNCPHNSNQGCGTVFELHPPSKKGGAWAEKIIHRFNPANSYEAWPMAGLIMDRNGRLFGTTHDTVFRLERNSKSSGSWTETILYFNGKGVSYVMDAPVIFDSTGNLYSTAYSGYGGSIDGNVFRLRPPTGNGNSWAIDVLYIFAGSPDGAWPAAGLIFDKHGSLYSTTQAGGDGQACQSGCGTVFEVSP